MFVAFAKMKKLSTENFAKAITSSAQIVLACCYGLGFSQVFTELNLVNSQGLTTLFVSYKKH
jgi:hypothetical protein